jgi:hypothetical protein
MESVKNENGTEITERESNKLIFSKFLFLFLIKLLSFVCAVISITITL